MPQKVLTGNKFLKGQSYPAIASEIVVEIKKGSTWDEEFFIQGDFSDWDIRFHISKRFGLFIPVLDENGSPVLDEDGNPILIEDRMASGRVESLQFGDFVDEEPILDEDGNPVLDEDGNFTYKKYNGYTYFKLILDSTVTDKMEISPIAYKEILQPKPGRDYWEADLEACNNSVEPSIVEPLGFDLFPVVVRGQV